MESNLESVGEDEATGSPSLLPKDGGAIGKMAGLSGTLMLQVCVLLQLLVRALLIMRL